MEENIPIFVHSYDYSLHTSNAPIAGLKVHFQVSVARFDIIEARIGYQNIALRSSTTSVVKKWKNIMEASNEHRIISMYFQEVRRYLQAASGFHSSPQGMLHDDHFASPTATVECLVMTVFLHVYTTHPNVA